MLCWYYQTKHIKCTWWIVSPIYSDNVNMGRVHMTKIYQKLWHLFFQSQKLYILGSCVLDQCSDDYVLEVDLASYIWVWNRIHAPQNQHAICWKTSHTIGVCRIFQLGNPVVVTTNMCTICQSLLIMFTKHVQYKWKKLQITFQLLKSVMFIFKTNYLSWKCLIMINHENILILLYGQFMEKYIHILITLKLIVQRVKRTWE